LAVEYWTHNQDVNALILTPMSH